MKNRSYHVYKHFDASGALLYVGVSLDATGARWRGHRSKSAWFSSIARIETQAFPTREEAIAAEAEAIRSERPKFNRAPGAVVVAKRRERDQKLREDSMAHKLAPLHPGEVLREEFMKPLGLTGQKIAAACYVPRTRIERIAEEKTGITADTALRLAKLLGTTPEFWMNLQRRFEIDVRRPTMAKALARIIKEREHTR